VKGLILGAGSGIGARLLHDLQLIDNRFFEVEWFSPSWHDCDVSNGAELSQYVRNNGPFKFIVYCPGTNALMPIGGINRSDLAYHFEVNVSGFILLMDAHEKHFPGAEGLVVAISSDAGRIPMRTSIAYCSSKAALNMAVRVAARELAPRWQINAVAPGIIDDTEMTRYIDSAVPAVRGWTHEKAKAYEQSMIPIGRRGTPAEISHVMRDLLKSPGYLTGSIVEISGGK